MPVSIVRLGSPRAAGEGLRLGTVRRPPRGVSKADFAKRDFYDLWLPALAPSEPLLKRIQQAPSATPEQAARAWKTFERAFRAEMKQADAARLLDLLAALSHRTSLAIGCYCQDESRCHRSILRKLLADRGADLRP